MSFPDDQSYMRFALSLAELSPSKASNFRVGAVLVDRAENKILSTGYTLELPGNTHAEQCCLDKFAASQGKCEDEVADLLPEDTVIYSTMEPCSQRLSGNLPCVDRIVRTRQGAHGGIKTVYIGLLEPETFIQHNSGRTQLENAGITCAHVTGLEEDILRIATAGHQPIKASDRA